MKWFEHLFGILAVLTCTGWSLLFFVALAKAIEEQRNDVLHLKVLKRRISKRFDDLAERKT